MSDDAANIIDLYVRHANAWAAARRGQSSRFVEREWLDRFRALIPPGGALLDLGCGPGDPIAKYFAGHGHAVTGVDSSPAMISMFQSNLPGHQTILADMRTLSLGQTFHGILAWDSFFHLNYEDQRRMFPIFRTHAAPGAALIFTSGPAHGEAIGQLEGDPLYHASLAPDEYRKQLAAAGFTVITTVAEDATCSGHTIWLAQRSPEAQPA